MDPTHGRNLEVLTVCMSYYSGLYVSCWEERKNFAKVFKSIWLFLLACTEYPFENLTLCREIFMIYFVSKSPYLHIVIHHFSASRFFGTVFLHVSQPYKECCLSSKCFLIIVFCRLQHQSVIMRFARSEGSLVQTVWLT